MLYFNGDTMKKYKLILIILIILILIPLIINFYVIFKSQNNIYTTNNIKDNYDMALVLGCSVLRNGKPSLMLKDRLDTAINLYNSHLVNKIIVSGDHKDSYSEVEVMKNYLIDNEVLEDDIILDYNGYNTSTSIKNYYNNYKDKSVLIISQKYHLYRANYIAQKYKINGLAVAAQEINYGGQFFREIREILARNKDFFMFLGQ